MDASLSIEIARISMGFVSAVAYTLKIFDFQGTPARASLIARDVPRYKNPRGPQKRLRFWGKTRMSRIFMRILLYSKRNDMNKASPWEEAVETVGFD